MHHKVLIEYFAVFGSIIFQLVTKMAKFTNLKNAFFKLWARPIVAYEL